MQGQKHLIKCRCILQQFKNTSNPPNHHFVVFSEIDDSDQVKQKSVQCNNCGVIHKVIDICVSEIIDKKEDSKSIITIDDIKSTLHPNLTSILEKNNSDIATWEYAKFITDNKLWGNTITISSDLEDKSRTGKILTILGETLFKVDQFTREEIIKDE
jgi:hypothetical protein